MQVHDLLTNWFTYIHTYREREIWTYSIVFTCYSVGTAQIYFFKSCPQHDVHIIYIYIYICMCIRLNCVVVDLSTTTLDSRPTHCSLKLIFLQQCCSLMEHACLSFCFVVAGCDGELHREHHLQQMNSYTNTPIRQQTI